MTGVPLLLGTLMIVAGLLRSRHRIRIPPDMVFLAALAGLARAVWVPISRHTYDGHEAVYLEWYLGQRDIVAGDTLSYPLLQWWWWTLGRVLPADERVPLAISVVVGVVGVCVLSGAVRLLAGRRAGWVAGVLIALHPTHVAWSSSAYNVILPHTLGMLAVLLAAGVTRLRAPVLLWSMAGALALGACGRIETIVYAIPCAALLLRSEWSIKAIVPILMGVLVAGWGLWPVVGAGPLPGADERGISASINLPLWVYHAPFDGGLALGALALLAVGAFRKDRLLSLVMVVCVVLNHAVMSTFDDYGARHTLPALVGIGWLSGAGVAGWSSVSRLGWPGWLGSGVLLWCVLAGMVDLSTRYYGDEEAFGAVLSTGTWATLPRVSERPGRAQGCGWIAEDPRVSEDPVRSHFNLLQSAEVSELRGEDGCLYWCVDVQDWRWSSRGVRNRALRLDKMYDLHPVSVLVEPSSGYSCLTMHVGERRSNMWPQATEWHGRGHPTDSRLP